VHVRVISELPVPAFFTSVRIDHDMPGEQEVIGVNVNGIVPVNRPISIMLQHVRVDLALWFFERVALDEVFFHTPHVRSIVGSSDCGVGANVDLSKDLLDSNLIVFPTLPSVCLIAGLVEAVVHNVRISELIRGVTKTNQSDFQTSSLVIGKK